MPASPLARRLTRLAFLLLAAATVVFWSRFAATIGKPASTPIVLVDEGGEMRADPAALPARTDGSPRVRLGFVGDIMQHRNQAGDDFDGSYAEVRDLIRGFDLAIGNLEFPVHPDRPVGPPLGSVRFNGSPAHLQALAEAGFDVLSTANNHAFDQGLDGARKTLEQIDRFGLEAVGTAHALGPLVIDVEGVGVGFTAYTYPPNAYPDEAGEIEWWPRGWRINALNFNDWTGAYRRQGQQRFERDIAAAQGAGAEVVVALVHWGEEWTFQPSADQRRAARDMIDAGFDLVVGGHAHVLNRAEIYKDRLIAYSLGNFISDFVPLEVRTGAILEVTLAPDPASGSPLTGFRSYAILTEREGHVVRALQGDETGPGAEAWALASRLLGPALAPAPSTAQHRPAERREAATTLRRPGETPALLP